MSDRVNLRDLWKITKAKREPLWGTDIAKLGIIPDYPANYSDYDRAFISKKGYFEPYINLDFEDDINGVLKEFQDNVYSLLFSKKNEFTRLRESLVDVTYNPIENYDRHEEVTVTSTGGHTTERSGSTTDTLNGGHSTERQGTVTETTNPFENTTTENFTNGFNSTAGVAADKNVVTNNGTESVVTSRNGDKDVTTYSNEQRTIAHNDDKDIFTYQDEKTTTKNETHGNIGVTTNQQMIESEVHLRTSYTLYELIWDEIIKNLCTYSDNGFECFTGGNLCLM